MKQIPKYLLTLILLTCITLKANAAETAAIDITDTSTPTTYGGTIGFEFTLSSDETVNDLGIFDFNSSSTPITGTVGLYEVNPDNTTALLAEETVDLTSSDEGSFVYTPITTAGLTTPVALVAGTQYVIGSSGSQEYENDNTINFTENSPIEVENDRYTGASGSYPGSVDHGVLARDGSIDEGIYIGPNFQFGTAAPTTPEPSTYALLGASLVMLVAFQRLKSRFR